MQFITSPMCAACGLPLPYAPEDGMLCGACLKHRPNYSAARAVFRFDDHSKTLVHQLKFQDELYLTKILASWMARAGAELIERCDVIVPTPMHRKRLISRRYNQSAQLAYALSRQTGIPCVLNGLIKTRNTPAQSGLTRQERKKNVRGAFEVHPDHVQEINGRSALLVDDVMTTGSTAEACAAALLNANAAAVNVLTLSRVANV